MPTESSDFNAIVKPHCDRLYRLAWRLTGTRAEAEDLFQELLLKAFLKFDALVDIDDPGPWLARVMYNLYIDNTRRFKRQRLMTVGEGQLPGDGLEGVPGGLDPAADQERLQDILALDRALQKLSDAHRITVLLHDTEGYKLEEIEGLTGVPLGTVKSRLHRARARLKEILLEDGTFLD